MQYHVPGPAHPFPAIPMNSPAEGAPPPRPAAGLDGRGLSAAAAAFFIWGLMPLYIKALSEVPVWQFTAHRLVWGCLFAIGVLAIGGTLGAVRTALATPRTRWRLVASAMLVTLNWTLYIWAVGAGRVVETSLGYFINPLLNVLIGVLFLSERLNHVQWLAVTIATTGVLYLTWTAGQPPWIALALALSFGLYGLVRKLVAVEALPGFAAETVLIMPVGVAFLVWCQVSGSGVFGHGGIGRDVALMLGGPLTAIPLVLFAFGARRIPYSTIGLLQYIGPSIQLALGVLVFHEPFHGPRAIGFGIIWLALAIYALDGLWRSRKMRMNAASW